MKKRLTKKDVLAVLRQHSKELDGFGVKKIGLFGSYLHGTSVPLSDLDFLVEFRTNTFDNYMGLKFLLERLFHKKVDLVIEKELKPAMRYVRKEAVYA